MKFPSYAYHAKWKGGWTISLPEFHFSKYREVSRGAKKFSIEGERSMRIKDDRGIRQSVRIVLIREIVLSFLYIAHVTLSKYFTFRKRCSWLLLRTTRIIERRDEMCTVVHACINSISCFVGNNFRSHWQIAEGSRKLRGVNERSALRGIPLSGDFRLRVLLARRSFRGYSARSVAAKHGYKFAYPPSVNECTPRSVSSNLNERKIIQGTQC